MCNYFWDNTKQRFHQVRHKFCSTNKLFILRLIGFLLSLQSYITHFINRGNRWAFSLSYLTIHGAIIAQMAFFFLLLSHCLKCIRLRPCCWRFTHLLFDFAVTLSIPIALMYWVALFPYMVNDVQYWEENSLFNQIELHSFILIVLLLEYFFDALQVYRSHVVFVAVYSVAYLVLNMVVTFEVRTVYEILTWRDFQSLIWAAVTLFIMLLSFYFLVKVGRNKKGIQLDGNQVNQLNEEMTQNKSEQIYY